jgi:hypothetical protein
MSIHFDTPERIVFAKTCYLTAQYEFDSNKRIGLNPQQTTYFARLTFTSFPYLVFIPALIFLQYHDHPPLNKQSPNLNASLPS